MKAVYCLCMIAKNEAHVIERAIKSAFDAGVTRVLVDDTGSTDGTQDIVTAFDSTAQKVALALTLWENFAVNRSENLAEGRIRFKDVTHLVVLDADDILVGRLPVDLNPDQAYTMEVRHNNLRHHRVHVMPVTQSWRYEGAVHEAAVCDGDYPAPIPLPCGAYYQVVGGGARSGQDAAAKFEADAAMLQQEYIMTGKPRTQFYMAQSYRDKYRCGGSVHSRDSAAAFYRRRAERIDGWDQERFVAALEWGHLVAETDWLKACAIYDWAATMCPERRLEPITYRAALCNRHNAHAMGRAFNARLYGHMPSGLFVDEDVYIWRGLDEQALAAHGMGSRSSALCLGELALRAAPVEHHQRLAANLDFYKAK